MKVIRDSGKEHWAVGQSKTCEYCDTTFQTESTDDFNTGAMTDYVIVACPRCGWHQRIYKSKNWNQYAGTPDDIDMSVKL